MMNDRHFSTFHIAGFARNSSWKTDSCGSADKGKKGRSKIMIGALCVIFTIIGFIRMMYEVIFDK